MKSAKPEPIREPPSPVHLAGASADGAAGLPAEGLPGPHPRLSLAVRVALFVVGWLLVLVGVAGLVLPGIQGIFTILVGAAVLSLVSEAAHNLLRKSLRRWPAAWSRVERFRERAHTWLHRNH